MRFTLANERTFLAWIRTSLALLAGGVALELLGLDLEPALRLAASLVLIVTGMGAAVAAWWGWARTEAALRLAEDGALVGCVALRDLGDGRAYLGLLTVDPERQAAGLGRELLAEGEAWARRRGLARVEMTVIRQRGELIAWYERRGYARTGETRPFPFEEMVGGGALRDDLHFVVLAKALPGVHSDR